jgi:D-alanyl-D-alanine carboxypeptidase|tara:strand:- start:7907 stop:9259 length:1353 start_codon:yes stop_codon:yes gene_type:complete
MNSKIKSNIKSISDILDVWVPMKIQYANVPGVNICIAHKGNPIYSKSFGYSDLDNKITLNENAIFRIASHSKMFTAVGIMQLQEQGKLKIDDSVNDYLPWFKGKNKISNNKNITIRQLLSHQSGIFRDGNTHHWDNHKFPENIQTTISEDSIIFENGSTFKYSNHAYATLGAIIEKISGETYGDFMNKNIIAPLNLKHTYPDLPDEIPSTLSNGYGKIFPEENKRELFKHSKTHAYASATGFMSTTEDIAIFLSSLNLKSSNSVLNRESKKTMIRSHGNTDRKNGNVGYGLGLDIETIKNKILIGHGGGYPGFITKSKNSVSDDIQVIVFTNTNSNLSSALNDTIFDFIYNSNSEIFEGENLTKNYNGIYRGRWGDMVITNIGSKLVSFSAETNNPRSEWSVFKNIDKDTFKNTDKLGYGSPGENIKFDKSPDQSIKSLTMPSGILNKIM